MNGERDAPPFHRLLLLQPLDHSVKRGGREDAVLASERFIAAGISQDMVIPASNTTGVALPVRQGFTSRAHYLVVLPRHRPIVFGYTTSTVRRPRTSHHDPAYRLPPI